MKTSKTTLLAAATLLLASAAPSATAAEPPSPPNVVPIDARWVTSGQPSAQWLRTVKQQGFEAVIYRAPPTVSDAVKQEPDIVRQQGVIFINIPIVFMNPTEQDVEAFNRTMKSLEGKRVLVHCQVNMRASVMTFLYRATQRREDPAAAYDAVARVWTPMGPWKQLIQQQLRKHAIDFDLFY
jgi:protein tyrosine phosphatase (PTP) superfamily phosphohydrolase (DUF442 family)